MNILADESVDYRIIRFLREHSLEVIAIIDNDASISDTEVLRKAIEQNALLITEDKNFGDLVFKFKIAHKGVLLLRFTNTEISIQNKKILEILKLHGSQLFNNFSTLNDNKLRIRKAIL